MSEEHDGASVLSIAVALYQQGRSADEVAELTGIPACVVTGLARVAGLARRPREAKVLANRRWMATDRIARSDIEALTIRWILGEEVDDLAAGLTVPADLLWDAIAAHLSTFPAHKIPPTAAPEDDSPPWPSFRHLLRPPADAANADSSTAWSETPRGAPY